MAATVRGAVERILDAHGQRFPRRVTERRATSAAPPPAGLKVTRTATFSRLPRPSARRAAALVRSDSRAAPPESTLPPALPTTIRLRPTFAVASARTFPAP